MNIFYGICGEGMGHSGRALAVIERLVGLGHRVSIFTFAEAHQLLARAGYQPHLIEGLRFRVKADGGVDTPGTASNFLRFLRRRRESLDRIRQHALAERVDLFITDFEPLTALAAASLGIPCVSIDNQHRFCQPLADDFPWFLRTYARLTGEFVRRWIKRPRQCIVAVFHRCPPSRHYEHVESLHRAQLARLQPTDGDHILIYAKGELGRRMATVAATVSARFRAYGFDGPLAANIEYRPVDVDGFAADLASCCGVLCTAGQQLIGEARYFGKPLLVIPMPRQYEQEINSYYVRREHLGDWCTIDELTGRRIEECFGRRHACRAMGNGVDQVLELMGIGHG